MAFLNSTPNDLDFIEARLALAGVYEAAARAFLSHDELQQLCGLMTESEEVTGDVFEEPPIVYFCGNGHMISRYEDEMAVTVPHHHGSKGCPFCGNTTIIEVYNPWGYDYWPDWLRMPQQPIGFDEVTCPLCGKEGHRVPRYDVRKALQASRKID